MEGEIAKLTQFGQVVTLYGKSVLWGLLILVAGLILTRLFIKHFRRLLQRFTTKQPLISTVCTSLHLILLIVVVSASLHYVGVEAVIIRRILIAITLAAIGLIVLFRPYIPTLPYKVGNVVQAGGLLGVVEATTFLNTRLKTFDGKTVFVPNSKILNDNVINYHFIPNRQVRLSVFIHYRDDLLKAKRLIAEIMAEDPRILDSPAARTFVLNLGDNGVELAAWGWVKNADYFRTRCDLLEKIKLRFNQEGITIPFPQRDVHIYQ